MREEFDWTLFYELAVGLLALAHRLFIWAGGWYDSFWRWSWCFYKDAMERMLSKKGEKSLSLNSKRSRISYAGLVSAVYMLDK
jgi:hypothetical protein